MASTTIHQPGDRVLVMGAYENIERYLGREVYMTNSNGTHYAQVYALTNGDTVAIPEA